MPAEKHSFLTQINDTGRPSGLFVSCRLFQLAGVCGQRQAEDAPSFGLSLIRHSTAGRPVIELASGHGSGDARSLPASVPMLPNHSPFQAAINRAPDGRVISGR